MAIEKIQLPNGQTVEISEWLHWPLFSTCEGAGGVNPVAPLGLGDGASINLSLFTYTIGQQVPVTAGVTPRMANESDTNQTVSARMNYDEAFICFSVTYEPFALTGSTPILQLPDNTDGVSPALTGTNLRRLQRDTMFELTVGAKISKPQIRAPLAYFGQGVGAVAYGPGDALVSPPATINMDYGTAGPVSPRNQRAYNLPVFIQSDRVMKGKFHSTNGPIIGLSQSWRLRFILDGIKRRAVA